MSLKRLPTPNADAGNWGTILNEYINQLSPTPKGGINTWTTGTRPSSLTVDDEGRTGINTDTNVIERWSGTSWVTVLSASSLGFTPENVSNKSITTTLGTSNTLYPTQNAVKSYVDTAANTKSQKLYRVVIGSSSDCDYVYNGSNIAVAINAALANAPATGITGTEIFIKAGDYTITSSISMKNMSNLHIIGVGMEQVTIRGNGLTSAFFDCVNVAYRYKFKIEGLTLDNTTPAAASFGVKIGLLSDSLFRDINIRNFETGLDLSDGVFYNNFFDVKTENCKNGVVLSIGGTDKPNSNIFVGCKFLADAATINGSLGVHQPVTINNGNQNAFIGCQFENFTRGIYVNDIGNSFTNNRIESNDIVTATTYVNLDTASRNNGFVNNYYSGNDYVNRSTSIVDSGSGNSLHETNTYKDQYIFAERNLVTADDFVRYLRSGSGNAKAVITAEDSYAASGSPVQFLAKGVRSVGKFFQGLLSGTEKFYVDGNGQGFFAGGILAGSQRIQNVATPTSAQDAATKDYVDTPFAWTPTNYSYISWNYDPAAISNNTLLAVGTAHVVKLRVPRVTTISNIIINIGSVGNTITNSYVALYQNDTLLAQSSDQSTNWTSTGNKSISITPQAVSAGTIDIVIWVGSASTAPGVARGGSQAGANGSLTGTNLRWSIADTGLTTTAPSTLGARTTSNNTLWAAVS